MGAKWCSGKNQCLYDENIECETHNKCKRCSWNPDIAHLLKELRVMKAEKEMKKQIEQIS